MNAKSAPSSVLSASAFSAASRKRLYCAGSSGLDFVLSVIFRPYSICCVNINRVFAGWAPPNRWPFDWSPILERYYFAVLVAICTCPMWCFGATFGFFQHISKRTPSYIATFIAVFFSLPCFKASHFFFKVTYSIQQRRFSRLGRYCALHGGEDFSSAFSGTYPRI